MSQLSLRGTAAAQREIQRLLDAPDFPEDNRRIFLKHVMLTEEFPKSVN